MLTDAKIKQFLKAAGWLRNKSTSIKQAIRAFQRFHDLTADGYAGPITQRVMAAVRYCSHDAAARGGLPRWPSGKAHFTWAAVDSDSRLSADQIVTACRFAFNDIGSKCGATFEQVGTIEADIRMTFGVPIDGPGSTLAFSNVGPGPNGYAEQSYDGSEAYTLTIPPSQNEILLQAVVCHELGHALGLDHEPAGDVPALLNPIYSPAIYTMQPSDVRRLQAIYGPPATSGGEPGGGDGGGETPSLVGRVLTVRVEAVE